MSGREIQAEWLLGRRVTGPDGGTVGRIEEIRIDIEDGVHVVTEYHIGGGALLERLGLRSSSPFCIRWDQIDLSDPRHPRTLVPRDQLLRKGK
jgi:sporulation protein YlmC with PRC-barrel domain